LVARSITNHPTPHAAPATTAAQASGLRFTLLLKPLPRAYRALDRPWACMLFLSFAGAETFPPTLPF
jgi:hypothetical protein